MNTIFKNTMSNKLHTLIGIVLFLSLISIRGMSQTGDQTTGAAKVENTQTTHVVKKSTSSKASNSVKKGYHATTRAAGKAWKGTKTTVAKGYHATAHATGKAWHGTKTAVTKGYNSTVHPPAKAVHKTNVKQSEQIKQEGETK
jgi:hypothetical protein